MTAAWRRGLAVFLLVFGSFGMAAAATAQAPAPAAAALPGGALSADAKIRALTELLNDPEIRTWLENGKLTAEKSPAGKVDYRASPSASHFASAFG